MSKSILEVLQGKNDNYILPFLWMRGEEEAVIREEIEKIDECGIKAVCLESRPHPDFAGPLWWRDFDIVLDEAKKRNMKIWILDDAHFPTGMANGLIPKKYPERAKQYLSVKTIDIVGPVYRGTVDIPYNMTKTFTFMDLGKPVEQPLVNEQKLVGIYAFPLKEGDTVKDECCAIYPEMKGDIPGIQAEIRDDTLICDFPEGVWRLFIVHTTYDEGGKNDYINMLDGDSVHVLIEAVYEAHYNQYPGEFGKTIAGFFSDEPGFANVTGFSFDEAVGRKKMPLPWSSEMPEYLEERLGKDWKDLLPLLFCPSEDDVKTAKVRYAYMDAATRLYQKHFSEQLGKWCADHNVEYIGHVIEDNGEHSRLGAGAGHYFRAMSGQAMAGIDNIGGQVIPGNPDSNRHGFTDGRGPFYHYTLTKMGASAALLQTEKKGRLMCETFGAYGWSFGVRDMKWVADHLITRGVNHLVPHAFSMGEYPDTDCPPHFYARGNNPEFPYFAELMKYCNRLCHVFSGGKWQPEVGILYDGTLDWMSECMRDEAVGKILFENMIDYALIPSDVLSVIDGEGPNTEHYEAEVKNEKIIVSGVSLKALIVPASHYADPKLLGFIKRHPEVNVLFVREAAPEYGEVKCVSDDELVPALKEIGVVGARANFTGTASFYHYRKDTGDLWMVFNESKSREIRGDLLVRLKDEDQKVYRYDAMKNKILEVEQIKASGFDTPVMICTVTLDPYSSVILFTASPKEAAELDIASPLGIGGRENSSGSFEEVRDLIPDWAGGEMRHRIHGTKKRMLTITDLSCGWEIKVCAEGEEKVLLTGEDPAAPLIPVSDVLPKFSGAIRYRREIEVDNPEGSWYLEAEHLYEAGSVVVNGEPADFRICPPYRFYLTGALKKGVNTIEVEVVNTPERDVLNHDQSFFGYEKGLYEPSGMFGRVRLIHCADE